MSKDASFITQRNRARLLFAAKVIQEVSLQNSLKNSINLEGPLNHTMTYDPHYYAMKDGAQFTTLEEYNNLIQSAEPQTVPGRPTNLSASPDNNQLTISFTEPSNGGSPITNYEYYPLDASGADWTPFSPPDTSSPVVITGLPNGSPLRFKLRAVNAKGPGAESAIVTGTPADIEFDYPNFSSTTDIVQISTSGVIGNVLYLTQTAFNDVGNVYRSTAIPYNRSFSFEWNFECSGGTSPPADGYCLQWTPTNNTNGGIGGACGYLTTAIQALFFKTVDNTFYWYNNNVFKTSYGSQNFYRNLFYWADYNHSASIMNIYISLTNTKPGSATFSLTGFSFDSTNYYIGFGAATGAATENHILRSMKLTFT